MPQGGRTVITGCPRQSSKETNRFIALNKVESGYGFRTEREAGARDGLNGRHRFRDRACACGRGCSRHGEWPNSGAGRQRGGCVEMGIPGATITGIAADLSSGEGCEALIAQLPEIDVLVNNLSIYEIKTFEQISDDDRSNASKSTSSAAFDCRGTMCVECDRATGDGLSLFRANRLFRFRWR